MPKPDARSALPLRPYLAVLRRKPVAAIEIGWWWLTGRRVRARNKFAAAAIKLPDAYRIWLMVHQPGHSARTRPAGSASPRAVLAVHLHLADGHQASLAAGTAASVSGQLGPDDMFYITGAKDAVGSLSAHLPPGGRFCAVAEPIPSRAEAIAHVLARTHASHLVPVAPGNTLTPGALAEFACAIGERGGTRPAIFYADQDERGHDGQRANPWLKPAWDEDLFLAQDFVSSACAIPVAAARQVIGDVTGDDEIAVYETVARLAFASDPLTLHRIEHIAATTPGGNWHRNLDRTRLIEELLESRPADRGSRAVAGPFGTVAIRRTLPAPPRVSVIVPTRDRLDLLEKCLTGVLGQTDYPDMEVIVADNQSVEPETLRYFKDIAADPRVRIAPWPHPYNYAAINNFAASQASGQFLCLLNNDTEIVHDSWLAHLMAQAIRPGIGAVGARLLYPDQTLQHAGIVIGMGGAAGHAHRGQVSDAPGWFGQAHIARGVSAVTAACLVVAKAKFDAVGGLDERRFAIAYNDVDLCLKLQAAGWRNLYVPQATLIHHESKSRGPDFAPAHKERYLRELAALQEKWHTASYSDPNHHPALDRSSEDYRLSF